MTTSTERREPLTIPNETTFPLDKFAIPPQYQVRSPFDDFLSINYRLSTTSLQPYLASVLIPHGMVVDRVDKLAADIRLDYPRSTPHLLVVLKVRESNGK